ncbi:hypothetical protein, conserved [Trypanosoma cruzi]|uniref:3-hydroxyacyl-CoA dehydrogenase n=1 Tax=Trypanosoma cruzi (strain CL Brener) TaxID=353153 RepID=Q4DID3_TRYCC|nr:hypothetical protein, conserved [Trypanosoma cruzi]EAN92286.1 hypothetical protein, conserved [Trypanosoma cruzi]|eukprot:XP_814137.1 hypothetical protein [Trypanosoma cruzi strain CL Brener]
MRRVWRTMIAATSWHARGRMRIIYESHLQLQRARSASSAPPKAAPAAPEPPRTAPAAPEPPRAAPAAPEPPRTAPAAPEPPKAAPAAPEPPRTAPAAPEPPRAAPAAPEPPRAAPAAPEPPRTAPAAPEPPRTAPAAPEPPRAAPAAPEPPRTAPAAPEPPRTAPAAPEPPRTAPAAPEPPRAAPAAPEPPRAAPAAPEPPRAAPAAPEPPRAAPAAPEPPRAAPAAPEPPRTAPAAPEPPRAAPAAPEPPRTAPAAPEPPRAAPAAPEPPRAAPAAPVPPRTAPAAPEPPRAAPAAPEPPRTAPAAPEPPKAAPAAPEPPRAAPAAPEPPRAAPAAPEPPRAAPAAPEPPRAAPAAPEPPRTAPAAPEPPRAAPAAPEPPRTAPAAPEPPRAAPAAPEPPRTAPAAPEPPRTAPAAPEPPRTAPAAPVPPRAAPSAPEPPRTAPAAPEPPRAAPAAPEPPRAAPAAPEPPRTASSSSFVSARKNVRLGTEDNKIRGYRKRGGEREDRHPSKRGESFQFKGKPTGSGAKVGSKRLSLNDIIDDLGEIKVVFAQRGTDKPSHTASPPSPPIAPSAPLPPSPTPSLPQQTLPSFSAPIPSTGGTGESLFSAPVGTSQEGEDDIFFTIAPRTSEEGFQGRTWPKSVGFSVDEEIETARATRPLVPSPDVAQETNAKLRLNVVNDDEQSMADMEFDKNKLNPLPHKEAAEIGRHEIPDVVSERADFTQPMPTKDSSKNNEKTEHSTTTASLKPMEESSSFPLNETATPSPRNAATKMPVERPPLAPWMPSVRPEDGEDASCAKVSFKNDGSPVTTILLETQPTNIMSLVKFLHRTITLIENQHIAPGKKTEVLFTTFPTLGFFNAKHGPLELTSGERVELLRAKESLFARMENASKQIHFVANVHGGAIEDFGAELFLACHHRVLLDPAQATFGFPSIKVGDFPAASTVRRLSCFFGSQRTIEMAPRFHEYSVESIMDVGLLEGHSSPPAPSFLLRLECAMLEFLSRATQKELLLRKLFFTSGFDTSAVLVSPNPLLKAWGRYAMAAIVQGKCATNNDGKAVRTQEMRSESIFSEMLYTTPAINAANVCSLGCEMKRRALPSLPSRRFVTFRGEEMQQWDEKMKALSSAKDDCAAVLLDCSQRFINATAQIVASHQDILVNVNVVLIGEEHVARPIISTLPCSVVVSCASPYRVSALGRLQEVRVFAQDSCSSEASETALNAALTYLQTQDSPYVVSRGSSSKRLIAALATEACRLTQHCDVACIERVATDVLGLFVGPFHLIDYFGPAMVIRMLEETNNMNTQGNPLLVDLLPAIAHHALNGMLNDGYLGVDSRRGGFFSYREDGTAIAPNAEVLRRYFSRPLSDTEVADRLLAVVVNECCEMILSGCVRSATDANVLTIAAIGFRETTGGALALADKAGISALVQKMEELSNWHGPHLRPSSLLKCMAHSKVSFASLSDAMIQSARM